MAHIWITILAFTVIIPTIVGMTLYRRIDKAFKPIVWLCVVWTAAEVYSYMLRINGSQNAHISYILTAIEIYLFSRFYDQACTLVPRYIFKLIGISGFFIVAFDFYFFRTGINTFSLTVEYILLISYIVYLFYENVMENTSRQYYFFNIVVLFYTLSSFPYFFTWEWLHSNNIPLLMIFGNIHAIVHTFCYFVIAFILWKSSLSLSQQSSFQ
jgi:hypothetical protein